ncbi:MAG: proteasome-activating nucleotidase [Desulfurococcales archaeon]|nr:proteasome-activating nucleotidase [Desulfurococcales archaeon]MEB3772652.1 proteasome-activating nucleotidase [Desulfurococcales archaeon]MEB3786687.1 proteasome-activating nucleotidase [Desulfurococcales archaeon]MEB3799239.1 proteasome-activating nucleotidase [Desulfurococcales archaeon]MEB3845605.1 proteasome-activating nucleotidase [Desulfurococcales archaeon]
MRQIKELEAENASLRSQLEILMRQNANLSAELQYYKKEVEKLVSPPLIEALVLEVLDDGERAVVKSTTGPNLIVKIDSKIRKEELRAGVRVALNQRGSTIVEVLKDREDPIAQAMEVIERPQVSYKDIGGLSKEISLVREVVELPLTKPDLFKELGIDPPKGVLLYGPPGTGKTLLAKAVAHESNATFIRVVASEFVQKFIGEGARIVREVFKLARKKAPAIIFIDEIDAIGAKRLDIGTSGEREVQRTLMQLLAEMDGFNDLYNVRIIAATNRIDILDPALLRPGRFDRVIEIPAPDLKGRIEIFKIHTRKMKLAKDVDFHKLAELTEGFTGADIKAVCTEAGYNALRANKKSVRMKDFLYAINFIRKNHTLEYRGSQRHSKQEHGVNIL